MEKKQPPRAFVKGTRVEICPFRRGFSHHYLAHLDGKKGTVVSIDGYGTSQKAFVKIDGTPGAIGYPTAAIRPIEE